MSTPDDQPVDPVEEVEEAAERESVEPAELVPAHLRPTGVVDRDRHPTIVVDDLHITYRVLTTGKKATGAHRPWARSVRRQREVHALKGVTFAAYDGEVVGIIGHNGSGKSTLCRAIAGLITPTSGMVYADGEPALLGVNAALIAALSGERNIYLGGLALGLSRKQVDERYDDIVRFAGLREHIELPMKTYSSGMQARLRFAIATAVIPRVLLIDEALATGDTGFKRRSARRIERMRNEAGTVVIVTHSMGTVRKTCNRAIWLDHGRILADGPPDEVVAAYESSLEDD